MSPPHLHLLLNHFPATGFIIGLGLFVAALIARSDHLKVGSLVTLVIVSIVAIPAYVSGNGAAAALCVALDTPGDCVTSGVSRTLVERHEGAALLSIGWILVTGGLAWLGLWQRRRHRRIPAWTTAALLVCGVLALATVSRASNLGGEIRHSEIRIASATVEAGFARQVGRFVAATPWVWVACETLHFVGLTLLFGVVLAIDLKAFGFMPGVTYAALDRLLPLAMFGFGINVITGMMFFVAAPSQYAGNAAFYGKLAFIVAAALNTLLFIFDRSWADDAQPPSIASRAIALGALFLWAGAMYWGSMLPFIGGAF